MSKQKARKLLLLLPEDKWQEQEKIQWDKKQDGQIKVAVSALLQAGLVELKHEKGVAMLRRKRPNEIMQP